MNDYISENEWANRCYLVGPFSSEGRPAAYESLQELGRLCDAAGLTPVAGELVRIRDVTPAWHLGSGQAQRIITNAEEAETGIIVFDTDLSPTHMRNWSRSARREIYDRHAIILEIFYRRARTREAQLQVELARARYTQSHLVGMWQHLGRQGGGSRLARGEGEKQIEVDRRRLAHRVDKARRDLKLVSRQRGLRRRGRDEFAHAALVGYTNAGKSSLLNALTGSSVRTADQLFASLDPTTRRLDVDAGPPLMISDTVGFIRRLPPDLVDAFHSTLEEVVAATVILVVLDANDPAITEHYRVTLSILRDLGAGSIPRVLVFNKSDLLSKEDRDGVAFVGAHDDTAGTFFVSASGGEGISELRSFLLRYRTSC